MLRTTSAYNATNDKFFRIKSSGGNILFDTSPDGANWTNRYTGAAAFAITAMYIFIGSYKSGSVSVTTKFDDFSSDIPV